MRAWTQRCLLTCVCFPEKDHRSQSVPTAPPRHVLALNGPELKGLDVGSVFFILSARLWQRTVCPQPSAYAKLQRKNKKQVGMKGCQLPLWRMTTSCCMLMQIPRSFFPPFPVFSESLWLVSGFSFARFDWLRPSVPSCLTVFLTVSCVFCWLSLSAFSVMMSSSPTQGSKRPHTRVCACLCACARRLCLFFVLTCVRGRPLLGMQAGRQSSFLFGGFSLSHTTVIV